MEASVDTSSMNGSAPNGAIETPEGLIYRDEYPVYEETDEQVAQRFQNRGTEIPTDQEQVEDVEKMLKGENKKSAKRAKTDDSQSELQSESQEPSESEEKPQPKTYTEDDYRKKQAELQTAFNKKFYQISKDRDAFHQERDEFYQKTAPLLEWAQMLQSNPMEALQRSGIDIDSILNQRAEEHLKLANMTPEQRQEYMQYKQIQRDLDTERQEKNKMRQILEQVQAERQAHERQTRIGELGQHIFNLHKEGGLVDDPAIVGMLFDSVKEAQKMQKETGIPIPTSKVVQMVSDGTDSIASKRILAAKSLNDPIFQKNPALRNRIIELATGYATGNHAETSGQREFAPKTKSTKTTQSIPKFLTASELARMQREGKIK
jgi:hypothetical protein